MVVWGNWTPIGSTGKHWDDMQISCSAGFKTTPGRCCPHKEIRWKAAVCVRWTETQFFEIQLVSYTGFVKVGLNIWGYSCQWKPYSLGRHADTVHHLLYKMSAEQNPWLSFANKVYANREGSRAEYWSYFSTPNNWKKDHEHLPDKSVGTNRFEIVTRSGRTQLNKATVSLCGYT